MENNEFKNMNEFNGTGDNINKNRTGLEEIFSDSQTKQVQQETVQTVASEQEEKQNVYSQPTYHSPSYGSTAPIRIPLMLTDKIIRQQMDRRTLMYITQQVLSRNLRKNQRQKKLL